MITIKQGEDYTKYIELVYANSRLPVDLTGITAYSQMRKKPNGDLLATAVCTIDAANGTISVYYSAAQTNLIPEGKYGFDIWVIDTDNTKHPVYTAEIEVIGKYTMAFGA